MPETPVMHRGRGRQPFRPGLGSQNSARNAGNKPPDGTDSKNKRDGRSPLLNNNYHNQDDETEDLTLNGEDEDPLEKLSVSLTPHLTECSSQRLRCLHMTLRRQGNVDNRISEKDLLLAFQENNVNLTSRLNQMITETFGDHQGIDYERLYKCLVSAHNMTGRDSVKARRKRNDLTSRPQMSQEKRDADFLSRIELQLIRDQTFFDIDALRTDFQEADSHRTGKIKLEQMQLICQDKTPLYGALLINLLRRCDEDKNETVSWPTLLSFLERGQNMARQKDPELHLLPEKARATAAVNVAPDPISELSSGARARLVNTLLRRSSTRSGNRAGSAQSNTAPSVASPNSSRDTSPVPVKNEADPSLADNKEKAVSFRNNSENAEPEPQQTETKDQEGRRRPTTPANRVNLLSGMKRLWSGSAKKREAAAAERAAGGEDSKAAAGAGLSLQEVPLIEVDKASECELLSTESDSKDLSTAKDTAAEKQSTTTTTTATSSTTTTTTSTTITTSTTTTTTTTNRKVSNPINTTTTTTSTTTAAASSSITSKPGSTIINIENDKENSASVANNSGNKVGEEPKADGSEKTAKNSLKGPVVKGVEVTVPTDYTPPDIPVDPPNQRLQLDWVYGCRGNDCRRNVQLLGSGELIYFISNVCVVLNHVTYTQRHYKEHTEDVKCLTIHSNGLIAASGQFASKLRPEHVAHIRVWRTDLMQTAHVLGAGTFSRAVVCLAFMPGMDILVAVDNSPEKRLTVWDMNAQEPVADNYFTTDTVCDMEFNPKYPDLLVTCGKEHMQWWKLYPQTSKIIPFLVPDYESYLKAKYVVCLAHTEKGDLITGDSNGTVYIWGNGSNQITNFIKHGHDGPVLTVLYHKGYLLTGGRDGKIAAWTWGRNMDHASNLQIPGSEGGVRTVVVVREGAVVVSTTMNSMLSVTLSTTSPCPLDGVTLDPIPITQGHYDELRALAVIPNSFLQADVLTAGSDGVLCKFSSGSHAPVWKLFMKGMEYLCVDCSSKGDVIVLGTRDGRVVQLEIDPQTMQVREILNEKVSTNSILCISLSPDNRWIAAGGEDNSIYLFRLSEQEETNALVWNVWGILKGHGRQVVSVDWTQQPSSGGAYLLRSSSLVPEQKFWNVLTCSEMDGGQLTTLTWASNTCILDHLVTGVWSSKQAEKASVASLDVNPQRSLVAMGTSLGLLSLYRFPCVKDRPFSHTYPAHQAVQAIRFTPCGRYLFTVGGHDSALFQWKLI